MEYTKERQNTYPRTRTIADKLKDLEDVDEEKGKESKAMKVPFKWNMQFGKARRKAKNSELPCFIFTKDGYIDGPTYLPIRYGNLITWNDQAYKFNPEALWKFRTIKKIPFVYCIKEIDMEPISNLDLDAIRERGDSTEHHQFLLKQFLRASTMPQKKMSFSPMVIIIILLALAAGAYFLFKGG